MAVPATTSSLIDLIDTIPTDSNDIDEESNEDIFSSGSRFLYPDDVRNLHGDNGVTIIYKSKLFGDISLATADPEGEDERKLFSHYLWNAGILMAERISGQRVNGEVERKQWSVKGQRVLELGAGVGLAGIIAGMAGASEVVISDYPAPGVLANIRRNVQRNTAAIAAHGSNRDVISVMGHEWGILEDDFAQTHGGHFDCVIAADCFWMPLQHRNLAQSMLHFLSTNENSRVLAIGGFHTGRVNLSSFFATAQEEGLVLDEIFEEDDKGSRRAWQIERDGGKEDVIERKKWLCVATLMKATTNAAAEPQDAPRSSA